MSKITFYFDEMMRRAVATGLIERGYEVIMAIDIGMTQKPDDLHLKAAAERGAVLVTLDKPFAGRTLKSQDHAGLVCWTDDLQNVGAMIRKLSNFADQNTPEEVKGRVFWLKD